ncbi:MAG: RNA methyltransferase, partial [Kiritimatiellales bacterium]|nr:RNA methyltransferase [Kiritimatiellales bacterium]
FGSHLKLLADPSGEKRLADFFPVAETSERIVLAVGPEGGWTAYELEMLQAHGFRLFGMGDRILRTDTATIGLLSMLAERMRPE